MRTTTHTLNLRKSFKAGVSALLALAALTSAAGATDGYFQHGAGARHKALGGAGVADSRDATAAALNPAGIVFAPDNELTIAASGFMPVRDFRGTAQGFTPQGRVDSDNEFFVVPNMAWAKSLRGTSLGGLFDTIALSMSGNGGMNTEYQAVANPACGGGTGIFCGGRLGVNLEQAFLSAAVAKRFGNVSIGIAPILARQQFKAEGLGAFGIPNAGTDVSWGGGVRGGVQWAVMPGVRLGAAVSSRIYMQKFNRYAGLFAEQGDFDVPPTLQAGFAVDINPRLTFMADYKHIWYSDVASVSNPSTNAFFAPFGANNGPGFGWRDVDVVKLGLEYRPVDGTAYRVGYSYGTNPIRSRDVMLNILAPGVVQHHITAGAEFKLSQALSFEIAGMYAPRISVTGNELAPPLGAGAAQTIEIGMHQFELTLGLKYRFGENHAPLK